LYGRLVLVKKRSPEVRTKSSHIRMGGMGRPAKKKKGEGMVPQIGWGGSILKGRKKRETGKKEKRGTPQKKTGTENQKNMLRHYK